MRVGTRFIASEESDAHPAWIAAVIEATADDSVVTHAFNVGMPCRARTACCAARSTRRTPSPTSSPVRIGGVQLPPFAPSPPSRFATGNVEAMPFYAGRSAGAVTEVKPAAEIVAELSA